MINHLPKSVLTLLISILLLTAVPIVVNGQIKPFYGIEASYNAPLNGLGVGLRSEIGLTPRVSLAPNITYFPGFNDVHEILAGMNVQYSFITLPRVNGRLREELIRFRSYAFAGGYYNRWLNYQPNPSRIKETNFIPTAGVGASYGSIAYRFFTEFSYNTLADEGTIKIGILASSFGIKWDKRSNCPNY